MKKYGRILMSTNGSEIPADAYLIPQKGLLIFEFKQIVQKKSPQIIKDI